jgi:site-specific recombinase XerD
VATLDYRKERQVYRVRYTYKVGGKSIRRSISSKSKPEIRVLQRQVEELEEASRTRLAGIDRIDQWVERNWITATEAGSLFEGYSGTIQQRSHQEGTTDWDLLERDAMAYAGQASEGSGGERINRQSSESHFRHALRWLLSQVDDLRELTDSHVSDYQTSLSREFAPWTTFHRMTKLRIILDCGIRRDMIDKNVARSVSLAQPKRQTIRRILSLEEIAWLLEVSLKPDFEHLLNGTLPVAVRFGLYGGLRPIEMVWSGWDWIDWSHRVLNVARTVCRATGQSWVPKTHEARPIDLKKSVIEYLREEQKRQEELGILNQFIFPAGSAVRRSALRQRGLRVFDTTKLVDLPEWVGRKEVLETMGISLAGFKLHVADGIFPRAVKRPEGWRTNRQELIDAITRYQAEELPLWTDLAAAKNNPYLGRPMEQHTPQDNFRKMLEKESRVHNGEPDYTLYNLRHTFISRLLLPKDYGGAGLDIHTVQKRAGHADLKTTQQYLHDVDVMSHATDGLPY